MAGKKVTIEDLRTDFERVRPYLARESQLLPMKGDDSKCVLVSGSNCVTYSCRAMKGHLAFAVEALAL